MMSTWSILKSLFSSPDPDPTPTSKQSLAVGDNPSIVNCSTPNLGFPYNSSRFKDYPSAQDVSVTSKIVQEVGIDNIRPVGFQVLLKLYVRETMQGALEMPVEYTNQDQFNTRIGLILDYGNDAFSNPNYFPNGRWCRPGEWVLFSRYENSIFGVNGTFLSLITDDKLLAIVDDPTKMNTSQLVGK